LKERPPAPRDRLNMLLQGSILHHALAEWTQNPLFGAAVFERVFEEACEKELIPRTYRTEAVRLELLRCFEAFCADPQWRSGWTARAEVEFSFPLPSGVKLRGRIDRLETGP